MGGRRKSHDEGHTMLRYSYKKAGSISAKADMLVS